MIILDCEQGSEEWFKARLGIPTASRFSQIITPKTCKPSASAQGYLHELCAEWLLGESLDGATTAFILRGAGMEESAVQWYEFQTDTETTPVGFCLRDDSAVGCSPDRLIGEDGGLEVKCPSAKVHVGYLLNGLDVEYRAQVQGALWITGRAWWDVLSFNPELPPALLRTERDEEFIGKLGDAVDAFLGRLAEAKEALGQHRAREEE